MWRLGQISINIYHHRNRDKSRNLYISKNRTKNQIFVFVFISNIFNIWQKWQIMKRVLFYYSECLTISLSYPLSASRVGSVLLQLLLHIKWINANKWRNCMCLILFINTLIDWEKQKIENLQIWTEQIGAVK